MHDKERTVGLDERGLQLGDLLHGSVALDAVLSHLAIHGHDLVLFKIESKICVNSVHIYVIQWMGGCVCWVGIPSQGIGMK